MNQPYEPEPGASERASELDLGALWQAMVRKKRWIWWPTLITFVGVSLFVVIAKPVYTADAQLLLESQESYLPHSPPADAASANSNVFDAESVASQVQLLTSRDIARQVIDKLHLVGNPEFDPAAGGIGPISRALILFGIKPNPTNEAPEQRVFDTFSRRLMVFSPMKTRVLTIEFSSHSPSLAASVANEIAAVYLKAQSDAKRDMAQKAAAVLAGQIAELRSKLTTAADAVERYRSTTGLLVGSNNMTISGQQLADLNGELSKARTAQADAQAKATLVRQMIREHRLSEVADIANNDLVRRIAEQAIAAKARLAFESRTLLPEHPRIKELKAQIADLDEQLRAAAAKTARALETNATIAAGRVANLQSALDQQKTTVERANADQVHLNELQRVAQSLRDQLDASMAKYQDAQARENSLATPADARMIMRAVPPDQPSFPKKVPMIVFGTIAALVLSIAVVIGSELLASPAMPPSNGPVKQPRVIVEESSAPPASASFLERLRSRRRTGTDMQRKPRITPTVATPKPAPEQAAGPQAAAPAADPAPPPQAAGAPEAAAAGLAQKIAGRGARVVAISLEDNEAAAAVLIAFARNLTQEGRPIIIDIDPHSTRLAALNKAAGTAKKGRESRLGLSDLVKGSASFAEVIHRDAISRLHFINFGSARDFDPGDLEVILDALAQTYDFILLAAPALGDGATAKVLAPHADFVVLVGTGETGKETCDKARREVTAAGAKEVLAIGAEGTQDAVALDVA